MRRVALLGSTGSIGTNTLAVFDTLPDRFEVVGLSAGSNVDLLCKQATKLRPRRVCVGEHAAEARSRLAPLGIEVLNGSDGLVDLASDPDVDLVVNGLAAGSGLRPTLAAVESGKDVAIANKETLVVAGHIVTEMAARKGVRLMPLDSELTPMWQTLEQTPHRDVKRVILPASGGPFRDSSRAEMAKVTREEALDHPTWKMGPKITIDSATLMNKGFEVIEAHWFLGLAVSQIDVVIHPQSIVHSLIEFTDGAVTAHLSTPDMRLPIQQALTHPERLPTQVSILDLAEVGELSFQRPDLDRFPCLALSYEAISSGGTAPAVLNAANEVGVYAFLEDRIGFLDIANVVETTLGKHKPDTGDDIEAVFEADRWGRATATEQVDRVGG
jgi:1-deoxy-D-xylulose-5-phosphate reductoisomerase